MTPGSPRRVATCWTTAGATVPGDVAATSPEDIRARVEAAAAAGFDGIGINVPDLAIARDSHGDAAIRALLDDHGIGYLELDALGGWASTGEERVVSDARRRILLDAAGKLGADLIKVIPPIGPVADVGPLVSEFATLAGQAADVGARIGIEPISVCKVATPAQALDLVRGAGHPAAGVILDNWQISRAGLGVDVVRGFPPEWIASVELSDGTAEPGADFFADCFEHRRLPGSGELDVAGFVDALRRSGYDKVWGVEVLDAEYRRLPVGRATELAYEALVAATTGRPRLDE
ncbi:sugar phosphate isomerase/epimerase [Amycolatopsis oliviviridis]|uniref:sugar phosphate isomerase/epimerase family protein n=1 Tax=Amycolatopsis oliviviridis TaxID=1471590 RepID=UPI00174D80AC|nr:sugar phosphate isomerase/epimerase family protein [Amycolatopsis oliviviridis]